MLGEVRMPGDALSEESSDCEDAEESSDCEGYEESSDCEGYDVDVEQATYTEDDIKKRVAPDAEVGVASTLEHPAKVARNADEVA